MPAIGAFRRSSSFVVGAVFTALLSVGIVFVAYFLVVASDDALLKESEAAIRAEMRGLAALHDVAGLAALQRLVARRSAQQKDGFLYGLRALDGSALSGNLPHWPEPDTESLAAGLLLLEMDCRELYGPSDPAPFGSGRCDTMAKVLRLDSGYDLLVGRYVDDLALAQWVASTVGWVMIVILLLISVLSFWVGHYVVSRFNRISATMDDIVSTGNLARRLPVDSSWDDMSKLSQSLNKVLDELEHMVGGIKSVSDNIAHDLRTPLARLRGEIEVARMPEEERTRLLRDVDDLLDIFKALLRIAAIDSVSRRKAFARESFTAIVEDVVELYTPVAEEQALTMVADVEPAELCCDRDLLFQAVANVVDNAIKFTPAGGHVSICLTRQAEAVALEVCDTGCGIPEAEFENITRRFYRLEQSRTSAGNGLGLALVAAVVSLHQGTLNFSAGKQDAGTAGGSGTCCKIVLPALRHASQSTPQP